MDEFVKIGLTALGVALTTILGFFVTTVTEEFRASPTLAYSVSTAEASSTLRLSNVSRVTVSRARISVSCPDRPCFETGGDPARLLRTIGAGNLTSQVIPDQPNTSLIPVTLTMAPGAEVRLRFYPQSADRDEILVLFEPDTSREEPVQILAARSPTGFIIQNYVSILSILFLLVVAAVTGIIMSFAVLALRGRARGTAHDPDQKETSDAKLHVYITFVAPDPPSGSSRS